MVVHVEGAALVLLPSVAKSSKNSDKKNKEKTTLFCGPDKKARSKGKTPFFSKIDVSERLVVMGVIATTLTGIMPTIATDPQDRKTLEDTMSLVRRELSGD